MSEIVAQKTGIGSKDTYRKEKYIYENQSSLTPEDFADWDEGTWYGGDRGVNQYAGLYIVHSSFTQEDLAKLLERIYEIKLGDNQYSVGSSNGTKLTQQDLAAQ